MPPTDGRVWITPTGIAREIAKGIGTDDRLPKGMRDGIRNNKAEFVDVVGDAIRNTHLRYELTRSRLMEKIKDSLGLMAFGALVISNAVDTNGQPIKTPVGEIYALLKDIYTPEFLDMFDEEGDLLPEPQPPAGS